jgi:hypothetical protein
LHAILEIGHRQRNGGIQHGAIERADAQDVQHVADILPGFGGAFDLARDIEHIDRRDRCDVAAKRL